MPPCPAVTGATCVRTCKPAARPREWHNLDLAPRPAENEWAIGRLHPAHPVGTGALSVGFGMAARRARIATTDIRASARRGAQVPRAEQVEPAEVVVAVAAAVAAAATVADTGRSGGKP
ncbi:MAG: hypothetical protein ABSB86_18130 [Bryobacteraceae bacterium]